VWTPRYTSVVIEKEFLDRPWWLLPVGRVHGYWWGLVAVALIAADYAIGPESQFPVLYVIPVTLAAWYSGRWPALAMAIAVPLVHVVFLMVLMQRTEDAMLLATMTVARGAVILVMALWVARLAEHERQLLRYVIKLEGLLRICAVCKSIRNESGVWEPLETFISDRSDTDFTHGLCPRCVARHY
jgi:K+-sensing histidine kinase KdpD